MSEERPIYTIVEMVNTAVSEQEDRALRHLGRRVALYHAELIEAGMDMEVAKGLTEEFQDHLLSIAVGPHVYPPLPPGVTV